MKLAHGFSLVLLLASAAHAACPVPGATDYLNVCKVENFDCSSGGALSFIGIAFALVSFAIGIAYMYSKVREDPAAGVWAKDEAANLLITVLLFAGLLVFFTGSCNIAKAYATSPRFGSDPFEASQNYLDSLLASNGRNLLSDLIKSSISDQEAGTAYLYIGMTPFFGNGVAGQADMRAHSSQKEFIIDLYLPMVASLTAQKYLLAAIQWVGASVLLPFAFVMRLVPPTREFGNMLIALFFGLYIVVPTMYAWSGAVFANMTAAPNPPVACTGYCGSNLFYSYALDAPNAPVESTLLYRIGSTIPQAIFIPNLVIIVAVTCTMALSKALRALAV